MKMFLLMIATLLVQEPQQELPKEIAKWEKAIVALEEKNKTEATTNNSILFFGSSSIRRWDTIAQDMSPWPTIQRGYGGAKLTDASHYADRVIGSYLGATNPKRCKAVVIFVANDIGGKESDVSPLDVANRFARLHSYIRSKDRTMPVFWIEVTPTHKRWEQWPKIAEATQQIQNVLDPDPYAYMIPTAGAYIGSDGKPRPELFVEDQLHLNSDGYKIWSAIIKTHLHQRLGATKPVQNVESESAESKSTK